MESRSSSMSSLPYKISSKSTKPFKSYGVSSHPPQKFKRPPFWNCWSYEIKKSDTEVTLNGSTCPPNFTKIHRSFPKLVVGDTQTGWWFDKLTFIFWKYAKKTFFNWKF
jgi:hypothetical protein